MRTVRVAWDPAGERFRASGTHRGFEVVINAPEAATRPDGRHRAPTGFSATELLLAGAGACLGWDLVEILRKQRQPVTGLQVTVDGEQDPDPPWTYRRLTLTIEARGRGLDEARVRRAVRLSIDRYCSVVSTVRGAAEIVHRVEILDDAEAVGADSGSATGAGSPR